MTASHAYRLRLGRVVLEIAGQDPDLPDALARYFGQASDPGRADVSIELHLERQGETPPVPNSLIITKRLTVDGGFDIADGLIHGWFKPSQGHGQLHVADVLTRGLMTRVFEQILYQMFHSAIRLTGWDACLVHSSAVIRQGQGFLFVGPSEAGKSTIADLSQDAVVLNDEMNLIEFHADGPRLLPSPFNGHYRTKQAGTAPITALLLPHKGPEHRLEPAGEGEATTAVATQIAPPVPLEGVADPGTRIAMIDTASKLVQNVAVRRMIFRKDAGFWPEIMRAFPPASRG